MVWNGCNYRLGKSVAGNLSTSSNAAFVNENEADIKNNLSISADTGGNKIATTGGDALINTGSIDILSIIIKVQIYKLVLCFYSLDHLV